MSAAMPKAKIVAGSGAVGPRTSGATSGSNVGASTTAMLHTSQDEGPREFARAPRPNRSSGRRCELRRQGVGWEVLPVDRRVRRVRHYLLEHEVHGISEVG